MLAEQTAIAVQAARMRAEQQEVIGELRRGRQQLDWAEQQHRRLMQLVLDDIGLDGLVAALASMVDSSVTVEDGHGSVLAHAAANRPYKAPPVDPRLRRRHPAATDRYEVARLPGPAETWVAPVLLGGELVGRLWITGLVAAPDPGQRRMIERFALVYAQSGTVFDRLPWIIVGVGALLALGAAAMTDRLARRRNQAEQLAGTLNRIAAENRELYTEQRSIAQSLQHALLPEVLPGIPGLDVSARYVPAASGIEVGGDWYDVVVAGDRRVMLVIGDGDAVHGQ